MYSIPGILEVHVLQGSRSTDHLHRGKNNSVFLLVFLVIFFYCIMLHM
jgi:hypothetical protein